MTVVALELWVLFRPFGFWLSMRFRMLGRMFRLWVRGLRVRLRPWSLCGALLWLRPVLWSNWLRVRGLRMRFRTCFWMHLFRTSGLGVRFWVNGLWMRLRASFRMGRLRVHLRPLLWLRPVFRPGYLLWLRAVLRSRLLSRPVGHGMYHWRTDHRSGMDIAIRLKRLGGHKHRRTSVINSGELCPICCGSATQLKLCAHRRGMRSAKRCDLGRRRAHSNSVWAAVIADAVVDDGPVDDNRAVIDVLNVHTAEIVDLAVVGELITVPVSALIADASVAHPIIDAAVEADISAPVAVNESVAAAVESPISRRPQCALIRRFNPGARNPIVSGWLIGPVAGGPEISGSWHGRLFICWQLWRRLVRIFVGLRIVVRFVVVGTIVATGIARAGIAGLGACSAG